MVLVSLLGLFAVLEFLAGARCQSRVRAASAQRGGRTPPRIAGFAAKVRDGPRPSKVCRTPLPVAPPGTPVGGIRGMQAPNSRSLKAVWESGVFGRAQS